MLRATIGTLTTCAVLTATPLCGQALPGAVVRPDPAGLALDALGTPDASVQQDAAETLHRTATDELNAGRYQRAAESFERLAEQYPGSSYAGDALYWAAFARYKLGGSGNLRTALTRLSQQNERYPNARTHRDGEVLATRIRGMMAQLGDYVAAESVSVQAAPPAPPTAASPAAPPAPPAPRGRQSGGCQDEDNELRLAALNALLQMDSERALPILRQVLERRDTCSVELRRKAVFLVSQKRGADVEDVLLHAAQADPDQEVRAQAVFWLSQVPTERAVTALDSILLGSKDREVQKKAVFALSQQKSARAGEALRRVVDRADIPDELKAEAIFWLGQRQSSDNLKYLQDIYPRLRSNELKEKVIFSISQMRDPGSQLWLMEVALNANEPIEMRKKALFWAGQKREVSITDLTRLYETINDREMKEQLIFAYSQRREGEAVDKLMSIAESEPDRELRRKAIFWLGQSKDPRAAEFLLRLINR